MQTWLSICLFIDSVFKEELKRSTHALTETSARNVCCISMIQPTFGSFQKVNKGLVTLIGSEKLMKILF